MSYDYELTTNITFNGVQCGCDIGFSIVETGSISVNLETETIRHPDGYFSHEQQYFTDEELDELPEFEIDGIKIYREGSRMEIDIDREDLEGFFILHPEIQVQVERAVEKYCEEDLFDDAVSSGENTNAYSFKY